MAWKNKFDTFLSNANLLSNHLESGITFDQLRTYSSEYIASAKELSEELHDIDWKSMMDNDKEVVECLIYRWSIDVLDVAILLRDAFLKSSKDFILELCKGALKDQEVALYESITGLCKIAVDQNIQLTSEIVSLKSGVNKEWFHQDPPTKEVADQLEILSIQLNKIYESHVKLTSLVPDINKYREYLMTYSNNRLLRLRSLKDNLVEIQETLAHLNTDNSKEAITAASKTLKIKSESIENEKIATDSLKQFNSGIGAMEIPIHADGGEMVYKDMTIDKKLESWTEDQLLPKLYDADLDIKSLYDSTLITLFNTRNKLENLALNEEGVVKVDSVQLTNKIDELLTSITEYSSHLDTEVNLVNRMVGEQLQASKIYDLNSVFLPELNFTNITKIANQRLWYKPKFWDELKEQVSNRISVQSIPLFKALKQDTYSFVEDRNIEAHNLDANSLFLKDGYLGRSFYIERPEIQSKVIHAIKRWRKGYQGSVLITGRSGSGKSSLMEFIPQLIDTTSVVRLSVKHMIKLNGRKHQLTHNLGEAINFLSAQSIMKNAIVFIDDLESWQNDEISMYETIKYLTEGISKYGKRLFFIISTNHFMHLHINRMFDFNSRFAEIINMDGMPTQAIIDALIVRHNASLKDVELSEDNSLGKRASDIATKSRNNIGSSMLAWERYLEKGVKMDYPPLSFNKLVSNHHLILKAILTQGNLKESALRRTLTNSDNNFLSEEVRKLVGFKILERTFDGFLKVNPFLKDDVEYVLLKEMK